MHFSLSKISPACNICNIIYSMHFEHFLFFPSFFYFFPQTKGRQFEENSDTRGTIAVGPSKGNTFLAGDFHTRVRRPG